MYIYKLALKLFKNREIAKLALFCSICSGFTFIALRTFSNSVEAVLTVVALYYWPMLFSSKNINENHSYLCSTDSRGTKAENKDLARQSIKRARFVLVRSVCNNEANQCCAMGIRWLKRDLPIRKLKETSRMIIFQVLPAMAFGSVFLFQLIFGSMGNGQMCSSIFRF